MDMKKIAILGSTGSIGTQTLEVVRENQDIQVMALAAGSNIELLEAQIREFRPVLAAVWEEEKAKELRENIKDLNVKVVSGMDGLKDVAVQKDTEILVTAIVGMIGILPTIEGIRAGKNIALANKETLVTAGHIIMPLAKEYGVSILPVDSEHSAIFQSLQGGQHQAVSKILLISLSTKSPYSRVISVMALSGMSLRLLPRALRRFSYRPLALMSCTLPSRLVPAFLLDSTQI